MRKNRQLERLTAIHNATIENLKKDLMELKEELKTKDIDFKYDFEDPLTSNKIAIALKNKKKALWSIGELSTAFTFRYFSNRSYIFKGNVTLPIICHINVTHCQCIPCYRYNIYKSNPCIIIICKVQIWKIWKTLQT